MKHQIHTTLSSLLERLDNKALLKAKVIPWSSPVPSFGDLSSSTIATLGLNPSNREFVDVHGNELDGDSRRFHTLKSLGLQKWSDANTTHRKMILESCNRYFHQNPYDGWFKGLNKIISGTRASYYDTSIKACHLDLIPYATACKWTELTRQQRALLLEVAGDTLGLLLRDSPVRLLILNGQTVTDNLQRITGVSFEKNAVSKWTLPRKSGKGVKGLSYKGTISEVAGVQLNRNVYVLGFNHNIQSSYGVTTQVKSAIQNWVTTSAQRILA
jgi:hypothetical protein